MALLPLLSSRCVCGCVCVFMLFTVCAFVQATVDELGNLGGEPLGAQAKFAQEKLKASMKKLRSACDATERVVPSSAWPLPTYHDMLFHQD